MFRLNLVKRISKTRSLLAAGLLGLVLASPAVAQGPTVKFMDFPGAGNMLIRVAISKGYCQANGITCQLQMFPTSPLAVQAVLAKTIDSAVAPSDVIISAIKNGTKIKMVTGSLVSNLLVFVASNDMPAPNASKGWPHYMADFKGKRIGVTARGASTETGVRYMMSEAGLNPDDATYVAVGGPVTAYNALASKQIDALMIVEPVGSMCNVLKTCRVVWRGSRDKQPELLYGLNGSSNGLVFAQSAIDADPAKMDAVIKAVKDADAFINNPANFDEVVAIAAKYFKFELEKGDEIMRVNLRQFVDDGTYKASVNRKSVKDTVDYLMATKLITSPVDVSDLVYDKAP